VFTGPVHLWSSRLKTAPLSDEQNRPRGRGCTTTLPLLVDPVEVAQEVPPPRTEATRRMMLKVLGTVAFTRSMAGEKAP